MSSIAKRLKERIFPLRIRHVRIFIIILSSVLSYLLIDASSRASMMQGQLQEVTNTYVACENATMDLREASAYLTTNARLYILTHDQSYLEGYVRETSERQRREDSVETLVDSFGDDTEALLHLRQAMHGSKQLEQVECKAMTLVAEVEGQSLGEEKDRVFLRPLVASEQALSPEEKEKLAEELLFGIEYQEGQQNIMIEVDNCLRALIASMTEVQETCLQKLDKLYQQEILIAVALLAMVILNVATENVLIMRTLTASIKHIAEGLPLPHSGAYEMRFLSEAYNKMYELNKARHDMLTHEAEHDSLTGLLNRGGYDALMADPDEDIALLLFDVDYFKGFNDTYGHAVGDDVLKKVASSLTTTFRASDHICRIGGDEFAVIMTSVTPANRPIVERRIAHVRELLADESDGLPAVTTSIGVAFAEDGAAIGDIFKAADVALYAVKERGRNGYAFSSDVFDAGNSE